MASRATTQARVRPAVAGGAAPDPARMYRSARQRERGERILEVTRAMLTEAGYHGVTMRDVCARAGVARKTLYDRYGSKDALILAAVVEVLDDVKVDADALAGGETGIATVLAAQRAAFRQIVRAPNYAAAMAHALFDAPAADPLADLLLGAGVAHSTAALAQARDQGELSPATDIDALARSLMAQNWGVILMWMKGLVHLDRIQVEASRAHLLTLVAATRGARREQLVQLLTELH
jgi:AcrR family transcriptional regulator